MHSVLYRDGKSVGQDLPLEQLVQPSGTNETLWIALDQTETDTIRTLGERFGLHPLALSNALEAPSRTRLDRFDDHYFLTVYATELVPDDGLAPQPMIALMLRNVLITIRPHDGMDLTPVRAEWEANPQLLSHGAIAMFWALLDTVVDSHFDTVQDLDERVSELEAEVFGDEPQIRELQHRCFILHREVTKLRRLAMPLRDVANSVLRHDADGATGPLTPYLQDVYDHALRVADWTDNIHDTLSTMFDSILNAQSNQLNVVMKKVTSWAAIIAVPTAITGFFGMNVLYPLFGTEAGFWVSIGLIAASTVALYWQFRRSDWL